MGIFTDAVSARAYVQAQGAPIVVKADGLAAEQGRDRGHDVGPTHWPAIDTMFGGEFGEAGAEVVIEEFMNR